MQLRLPKPEQLPAIPIPTLSRGVCVEGGGGKLHGALDIPAGARGLVLVASSRNLGRIDARQCDLARELNRRGLGTLLFDLVEGSESTEDGRDVDVLSDRLLAAAAWSAQQWGAEGLPVGFVGSGLGSAAALTAAAILGDEVGAVASHSGRPDLAVADLGEIQAPTLLVVETSDSDLVAASALAAARLRCPHRLRKVQGRGRQMGSWAATPSICRWMEWHLGSPEVPYEPRLVLG